MLTKGEDQMRDFISSLVEQIATAKADLIEGLLRNAIPHWQVKLFTCQAKEAFVFLGLWQTNDPIS